MVRLFLFLVFPALELYLLVKVGSMIGALNMVLWVFVSALIGIAAVRAQGQEAMFRVRSDLSEGRVPQNAFVEGLLRFSAGVMLILPGLITDAMGLLLLVPFVRHAAADALARYLTTRRPGATGASRVIFFRSGPGGPQMGGFGPGQQPGGTFSQHTGQGTECDPQEPRQATIIESTAIDITPSADDGGNDPRSGGAPRAKE